MKTIRLAGKAFDLTTFVRTWNEPSGAKTYLELRLIQSTTSGYALTPLGEDLLASEPLIPEDSIKPIKPVSLPKTVCPECKGKGSFALFVSMAPCQNCSGSGEIVDLQVKNPDVPVYLNPVYNENPPYNHSSFYQKPGRVARPQPNDLPSLMKTEKVRHILNSLEIGTKVLVRSIFCITEDTPGVVVHRSGWAFKHVEAGGRTLGQYSITHIRTLET